MCRVARQHVTIFRGYDPIIKNIEGIPIETKMISEIVGRIAVSCVDKWKAGTSFTSLTL
jgi:hypothetical protein